MEQLLLGSGHTFLEKEVKFEMKVNLFINNDLHEPFFIEFFLYFKDIQFIFQKMANLKLCKKQNNLFLCTNNLSIKNFNKMLKQIQGSQLNSFCFLLPLYLNKYCARLNYKTIGYPINILYLENALLDSFAKSRCLFNNLELKFDNYLVHIKNKKQVRLTEIESKIVKFLFENIQVTKRMINKDVLNLMPAVESKSLESHLYRLRKKLLTVDDQTQIIPTEKQNLKIINLRS